MDKEIGAEGALKLELVDGKLKLGVVYDGKGVDGEVSVLVDADYFVDKLAELIPGDSGFESAMVVALKIALKSVKI
jgi:uncharacterized protein (DUF2344 family)